MENPHQDLLHDPPSPVSTQPLKRPRTSRLESDSEDSYEPEFSHRQRLPSGSFYSGSQLPSSILTNYTMDDEYQKLADKFSQKYLAAGWELYRRTDFCDLLERLLPLLEQYPQYSFEDVGKGLPYLHSGPFQLYKKIHDEESNKCRSRNVDSACYPDSRPISHEPRTSEIRAISNLSRPNSSVENPDVREKAHSLKRKPSRARKLASDKPYQCTYCEKRYTNEGNRDNHEKEFHDATYTFTCEQDGCWQKFSSRWSLNNHHTNKHRNLDKRCTEQPGRPPKSVTACGVCGKMFRGVEVQEPRMKHIKEHYANRTPEQMLNWKEENWRKSIVVKAFVEQDEVSLVWSEYTMEKAATTDLRHGIAYFWDHIPNYEWVSFMERIEFGNFTSSQYIQTLVEAAYELAKKVSLEEDQLPEAYGPGAEGLVITPSPSSLSHNSNQESADQRAAESYATRSTATLMEVDSNSPASKCHREHPLTDGSAAPGASPTFPAHTTNSSPCFDKPFARRSRDLRNLHDPKDCNTVEEGGPPLDPVDAQHIAYIDPELERYKSHRRIVSSSSMASRASETDPSKHIGVTPAVSALPDQHPPLHNMSVVSANMENTKSEFEPYDDTTNDGEPADLRSPTKFLSWPFKWGTRR